MKVVFLGDSITDAGRNTTNGSMVSIGQSYPLILDAKLSVSEPGKYEFINTGVSGSRIVDIYARIKTDAWNEQPDIISILIGVNDVWHEFMEHHGGVDAKRFEAVYRMLLADTLERFPKVKFLMLEPFILYAVATQEKWDEFYHEVRLRADAVQRIAAEFHQVFVPLQNVFDQASTIQPAEYWLADGVHPTPAGHQLIADAWLSTFQNI